MTFFATVELSAEVSASARNHAVEVDETRA